MSIVLCIVLLVVLFMIGVPVAFSMAFTSFLLMIVTSGIRWGTITQQMIGGVNTFTLLAVPMFLLAGKLMNQSGTTDRLFNFAKKLIGWVPGGLGYVNIVCSIIFAGMSGTAVCDASGLGVIEINAMKDAGYDAEFSCGVTAASSTVGPIIPPSVPMVVYATISGVSVGALFMAGIVPGLLMAVLMMAVVAVFSILRHYPKEPFPTFHEFITAFWQGILPLMAPVIILLGIYTGWFTPTEAAAIVVVYSLILGIVYREITPKVFHEVLMDTVYDAATIGVIVGCATLFGNVIVRAMIPQKLLTVITASISSKFVMLIVINLFLLVVGMFLETTSAITILMPLLIPILESIGMNLIQFGVVIILNLMIGVLTPPFGIVLFVTARIGGLSVPRLVKAFVPWLVALIVALLLITFVPAISLWLPQFLGMTV